MNNRQLYKNTFSHLHADHTLDWEAMKMNNRKTMTGMRCRKSLLVVTVIMTLLMAMAAVSYAATDGAVADTIRVWINGQEAGEGTVTRGDDGSCSVKVKEGDKVEARGEGWDAQAEIGAVNGELTLKEKQEGGEESVETELKIEETTPNGDTPAED
ncbi:MAG: hypothetical protein ACI4LA_10695 [Emergencia sp.]